MSYSKIYVGNNVIPMNFKWTADLIPYYPFTVESASGNVIHLSKESYVEKHERETLEFLLATGISYWRKLKRKKVKFGYEEIASHIAWGFSPYTDYIIEIAKRIAEYGDKANITGIYLESSEICRYRLYMAMINAKWDEDTAYRWCYGTKRWVERTKI